MKTKDHLHNDMAVQGTQREVAGDNLAKKLIDLEVLEDQKKEYLAEYNARKKELQNEAKTISHIIRNYTPLFENVDKNTGEIT